MNVIDCEIAKFRMIELSQIEPLPPLSSDEEVLSRQESEIIMYSPISPSADRNLIKPVGFCELEFRLSVSHENNNVMWDLGEFAKAGKLLRLPPMEVEFYDEYEMRKVYSLIYDVFRCEYIFITTISFSVLPHSDGEERVNETLIAFEMLST